MSINALQARQHHRSGRLTAVTPQPRGEQSVGELTLMDEIRGVLEMIHIMIHWRDARNAIVPAWHLGPHVFARRRAHFAYAYRRKVW